LVNENKLSVDYLPLTSLEIKKLILKWFWP